MKILLADVETSPNEVFTWGIWQQNISINHMIESSSILCWSAKWRGEKEVYFDSEHKSSKKKMLKGIHKMLCEADAIVTYNGKNFDTPVLNREFLIHGMLPPSPHKHIDLLQVARAQFRFQSNKLEYVARELGVGSKVKHEGFQLWVSCMHGDADAWVKMEKYNKGDVTLLEKVYDRLLPWIPNHPNHALYSNETRPQCSNCGGTEVQRRGDAKTKTLTYPRFVCKSCGTWLRGVESDKRKPKLVQI